MKRRFYTRRFAVFKIPGGKRRIHHPTDIFFIPIVKRKVPYTNIQFGLHCIYAYLSFRPWQLCHAENSTAAREGGGEGEEGGGRREEGERERGGGGLRFLRRLPSAKKYEIYDNSLFHLFYSLCSLVFSRYVTSSSILFAIQTLVLR